MTKTELEARLRQECNLPFYNYTGPDRDYSEADFEEIKRGLLASMASYVEDYIDNADNDPRNAGGAQ